MFVLVDRLANLKKTGTIDGVEELVGKEEELRKRILAGLEAISGKGVVGAQATQDIWECILGWDLDVVNVEKAELNPLSHAFIGILSFSLRPPSF
jgi:hypothetical protein